MTSPRLGVSFAGLTPRSRCRPGGQEGSMRIRTLALAVAAGLLAFAGGATAHDEEDEVHKARQTLAKPQGSGAAGAAPKRLEVIGHANPGPTYNADVYAHKGHAYLASRVGAACLSAGVRVYDLADPTAPAHVSTFADAGPTRRSRTRGRRRDRPAGDHAGLQGRPRRGQLPDLHGDGAPQPGAVPRFRPLRRHRPRAPAPRRPLQYRAWGARLARDLARRGAAAAPTSTPRSTSPSADVA